MNDAIGKVFEFMSKHQQPVGAKLIETSTRGSTRMVESANKCFFDSQQLRREAEAAQAGGRPDVRVERASLVIEETGELLRALAKNDPIGVADALADLLYVTLGTAIAYSIPITECFNAVHESNMTKRATREFGDTLLKKCSKGPDFKPVDLKPILRQFGVI